MLHKLDIQAIVMVIVQYKDWFFGKFILCMSFKYPLKPGNSRVERELVVVYSNYKTIKK